MSSLTHWINRELVTYLTWSDFILNVFAVEPIDWQSNPLKIKPGPSTSSIRNLTRDHILRPAAMQSDWLEVEIYDNNFEYVDNGWIQWIEGNKLLILYNLLS